MHALSLSLCHIHTFSGVLGLAGPSHSRFHLVSGLYEPCLRAKGDRDVKHTPERSHETRTAGVESKKKGDGGQAGRR